MTVPDLKGGAREEPGGREDTMVVWGFCPHPASMGEGLPGLGYNGLNRRHEPGSSQREAGGRVWQETGRGWVWKLGKSFL